MDKLLAIGILMLWVKGGTVFLSFGIIGIVTGLVFTPVVPLVGLISLFM